mgnify:CR=1 FL=1
MKPYQHQIDISDKAYEILKSKLIVYLSMEERTGKTLTSILLCEKTKANNILVITKKKALEGWQDTLQKFKEINKNYTCINYESLHKLDSTKTYDLIIIDEAHANLSAYPKVGAIWKSVYKLTKGKPIIFLSATPSAQTYAQLYHQMKLSSWSPWIKFKNFYDWHRVYGIPKSIYAAGRQIMQYNEVKVDKVEADVKELFISYTRKELGFEHEPKDIIHYVELSEPTKRRYNELNKDSIIKELGYVADTPMKLLQGLYQLEGGTLKIDENRSIRLDTKEKIDYIKSMFGDTTDLVIFYHFKEEEMKLKIHFENALILQATSFAEGVDLSMYKTLVIYSMDFSTARYSQRRARQANMKRDTPIDVHYLLVKSGISEQVYNTVAVNKTNFIDRYFNRSSL